MVEQGIIITILVGLALVVLLLVFSFVIPITGFIYKRWIGVAAGCLLQPIIFAIILGGTVTVVTYYINRKYTVNRDAAMVTVREQADSAKKKTWFVKADGECFSVTGDAYESLEFFEDDKVSLYDVVPLDSFRVCLDDHIVIRFDLTKRQVTAADYDTPMEVVNVDWDKFKAYYAQQ